MLSALSVAELWRKEAARLAARSRLRASCRCRSTESKERSFTGCTLERGGFFGIGGGTFFSSCTDNGGLQGGHGGQDLRGTGVPGGLRAWSCRGGRSRSHGETAPCPSCAAKQGCASLRLSAQA